jgi:AcrR family transcriptional regulator
MGMAVDVNGNSGRVMDPMQERLITAAMDLLAHSGPSEIKVRRITETAGVSTIAVYHHFGGLRELLQSVVNRGYLLLREAFDHATEADPDPGVQLFAMALSTRDLAQRNPHLYDMMFGLSTRGTYRYVGENTDAESSAYFHQAYSVLVGACERLVHSGRIEVPDAEQVAAELWSAVHGFVTLEGAQHFTRFEDPVQAVLAPMAINHFVGMGDTRLRAERSAAAALAWWEAK